MFSVKNIWLSWFAYEVLSTTLELFTLQGYLHSSVAIINTRLFIPKYVQKYDIFLIFIVHIPWGIKVMLYC